MLNDDNLACKALWLDPFSPAGDLERTQLAAAGLKLLPVRTLEDLRFAVKTADAVIVRLMGDVELLVEVRQLVEAFNQEIPVICRIDSKEFSLAVEAMRHGACHVLAADNFNELDWQRAVGLASGDARPPQPRRLVGRRSHQANRASNGAATADASQAPSGQGGPSESAGRPAEPKTYVFVDPTSQKLLALAQRVAMAQVTTLITGPTGAGKEVLASVIHESSPAAQGPFVALNCGAIPENLMEDMLFGHEKGAYTGALREHKGVFEQAQGGTVFLDEIGELPMSLQAKLLRVLQEKKITRLGGQVAIDVDFRLIAATNRDLKRAMLEREFREDLYFRISTFRLNIPALKDRPLDILPLALQILMRQSRRQGLTLAPELTESAANALCSYGWPGNVRELDNVIQRALVLSYGQPIGLEHLLFDDFPFEDQASLDWGMPMANASNVFPMPVGQPVSAPAYGMSAPQPAAESFASAGLGAPIRLQDAVKSNEHQMILKAIDATPTKAEAAKLLGISSRTLRYKMAQLKMAGAA